MKQPIVDNYLIDSKASLGTMNGYSTSDSETIKTMFAGSPIIGEKATISDSERKEFYQKNVLDATSVDGNNVNGFNMNFTGPGGKLVPPDYKDIETGGGGKPASAWVPNPVSPGVGSVSPGDVGDPPEGFGTSPSDTPFEGQGSQLSPAHSSKGIANQKSLTQGLSPISDEGSRSS